MMMVNKPRRDSRQDLGKERKQVRLSHKIWDVLEFRAFGLGHCRYGTVDVCALRIFQNAKQHLNRGT